MTTEETRLEISSLNDQLSVLYKRFRELKEEISLCDQTIMNLNRRKWSLEARLIEVQKIPTFNPETKTRKLREKTPEVNLADLANLSQTQIETLLAAVAILRGSEE